ncbi:hypothetical protein EVAR_3435_1 [Eumeta japonica]|uniref:Uncharacterized protein n=1 Tax=Eumeta variegata TaxID=151549 RepID=A0A4C1SSF9_EUMVA|nr:hypothetical protein EVAR_3435_1 [Eumeta japonica]
MVASHEEDSSHPKPKVVYIVAKITLMYVTAASQRKLSSDLADPLTFFTLRHSSVSLHDGRPSRLSCTRSMYSCGRRLLFDVRHHIRAPFPNAPSAKRPTNIFASPRRGAL